MNRLFFIIVIFNIFSIPKTVLAQDSIEDRSGIFLEANIGLIDLSSESSNKNTVAKLFELAVMPTWNRYSIGVSFRQNLNDVDFLSPFNFKDIGDYQSQSIYHIGFDSYYALIQINELTISFFSGINYSFIWQNTNDDHNPEDFVIVSIFRFGAVFDYEFMPNLYVQAKGAYYPESNVDLYKGYDVLVGIKLFF